MATSLVVRIVGDASKFKNATGQVEVGLKGLTRKLGGLTAALGGAFAADQVLKFGADAVGAASDLNESISKTQVVFGKSADEILAWSDTTATALGQSKADALAAAGTFGNFFNTIGVGQSDAAAMSQNLTTLASDLASFNNADPSEVVEALGSALRGEAEPMSRFGVLMNEATLKEEALAQGLISTTKQALTPQQKSMAAYSLILKQTKTAQGDFARTSDGLANKQRILGAKFEDVKAKIGNALLPVVSRLVGFLSDNLLPAFERISAWVSAHMPAFQAAITNAVQNVIDYVRPVIETMQALWRRFGGTITRYVRSAFQNLMTIVRGAMQVIRGVIDVVTGIITGKWGRVWDGIKRIFRGAWDIIKGVAREAINRVKLVLSLAWDAIGSTVRNVWGRILNFFRGIPGKIGSAFKTLGDVILAPFKMAFNAIANLWNNTVGKLSFEIPSWVPGIGGNGFDVPDIPTFHSGGTFRTARAEGEGLALLRDGERVLTPGAPSRSTSNALNVTVHVHGSVTSERDLVRSIKDALISQQRRGFATA